MGKQLHNTRIVTVAVTSLLLAAGSAAAQDINLSGGADQIWRGTQPQARAGLWLDQGAVSNGDNRADLIVGAPGSAGLAGQVFVVFGGPVRSGELSFANADTIITSGTLGDEFGFATAAGNIRNLEGSGPRNLLVGAPQANGGRGVVYLFAGAFRTLDRLTTADAVMTITGNAGDRLGSALATADLNGDGYREIVIGAPGNGRVYVINGAAGLSGARDLQTTAADATIAASGLGSVMTAGDVTGDGVYDLLLGAPDANRAYLLKGRAGSAVPSVPDMQFTGAGTGDRAGEAVRMADLDHDGTRDVIIGAPLADGPNGARADAGAVYVLWGRGTLADTPLSAADVTFHGSAAGLQTGASITSGDINRDDPNDVVFLAPGGASGAGELYVYYGRRRTTTGTALPDGRRVVDLAVAGQTSRRIIGDLAVGAIGSAQVFEVTGEGARDIIAGVPAADGSTGAVYFTISPKLRLSRSTATFLLNEGETGSTAVDVQNPSSVGIAWTTTTNRAWLTASPASGNTSAASPGSVAVVVSTAGLAPGVHTGTVTVSSASADLEMALPITVTLTVAATKIALDSPANGATIAQPFTIAGWALDAGAGTGTGVDAVHVYATPNPGSGAPPQFLGAATYGGARGDVGAAFGSRFTNSGFGLSVQGMNPGVYEITAYARSTVTGGFNRSARATVTIGSNTHMAVDAPAEGSRVPPSFTISGWAIDRAATTGTGVDAVQVFAYPNPGSGASPISVGEATYGGSRADIGAAYGSRFTPSGFTRAASLTPGRYQIVVSARSTLTGAFSISRTVNVIVGDAPDITVNRSSLNFAIKWSGSALTAATSPQVVTVSQTGVGTATWTATTTSNWLTVHPASGTGSGTFTVYLNTPHLPPSGNFDGVITVQASGESTTQRLIPVRLRVHTGNTSAPFGFFDTPINGATDVVGAFGVTGWVLDDVEVAKVDLWRDPIPGEPVHPNGLVYIGNAVLVDGARPDVEGLYPESPNNYRAGWGYQVLSNLLPNRRTGAMSGGIGTFRLHAFATDREGKVTNLGARTITCANDKAVKPFGTIDTPAQGGVTSGKYVNWGWALAPTPNAIPNDGSTIHVFIDGIPVGRPTYNHYRSDIATLFPGRANSAGAVGYYVIDTTLLSNGVHSIAWSVTDDKGNTEGIGSRWFTVFNQGATSASVVARSDTAAGVQRMSLEQRAVTVREGLGDEPARMESAQAGGGVRAVTREFERVQLDLAGTAPVKGARFAGYLQVGDELRDLPAGSTLEPDTGMFAWSPGLGFVGDYQLVFVRTSPDGTKTKIPVAVTIVPRFDK